MIKSKLYIFLFTCLLVVQACRNGTEEKLSSGNGSLHELARAVFLYDNKSDFYLPQGEYGVKETLGKMLWYDTRLSKSGFISCNSCHNLATYGADRLALSPGHKWLTGERNSPTVLNAYLHIAQFWDGSEETVETQALLPIKEDEEMAMPDDAAILTVLLSVPEYVEMFALAFPGNDPVSMENLGNAIGAFERRLVTPAPIHKYLSGVSGALSDEQLSGLSEFINVGCATCHVSETLGGKSFAKFVPPFSLKHNQQTDKGRFEITGDINDMYFFKVPSLLNVVHTYPYFHDGSVWELPAAVRIISMSQLNIELNDAQVDRICHFMEALTGEIPKWALALPILPPSEKIVFFPDLK